MPNNSLFTFMTRDKVLQPRGINDAWWINHSSYGKEHLCTEDSPSPYLAANEWICGHIADFLRLGVPPFALFREPRAGTYFASLQFTPDKTPPGDTKPSACWQYLPEKCTGVLLFDILVGNDDRRCDQMAVDDPRHPKVLTIFDHDQALFGAMLHEGGRRIKRLQTSDELAIAYHCFLDVIDSDQHFATWFNKLGSIPEWFLKEICDDAAVFDGVTKQETKAAAKLLIHRAHFMRDIVRNNRGQFSKIKRWGTLL